MCDAAREECLAGLFQTGNANDLASYLAFFAGPSPRMMPRTVAIWERAARIRAAHHFSALDARTWPLRWSMAVRAFSPMTAS